MERQMRIKPTDLDIVETTQYFPVRSGWVFQTCIVREADGTRAYWDIPLSPIGQVR
jgi:hypothetical protein